MSKQHKSQLIAMLSNGIVLGTELGTAFMFLSAGLLIPYALLSVVCALTFPERGLSI